MNTVYFEHWKWVIDARLNKQLVTKHLHDAEKWAQIENSLTNDTQRMIDPLTLLFQDSQILLASNAFPETSVSNVLDDIDLWEEWRSYRRGFPFGPGWTPWGPLKKGKQKINQATIGAIGEIFAGLFGQAGIAPIIQGRPINRWPDLIFYNSAGSPPQHDFAFVESKASSDIYKKSAKSLLEGRFFLTSKDNKNDLNPIFRNLEAFPEYTVWLALTSVTNLAPREFLVTFLEIEHSKKGTTTRSSIAPPQIIDAIITTSVWDFLRVNPSARAPEEHNLNDDIRRVVRETAANVGFAYNEDWENRIPSIVDEEMHKLPDDEEQRAALLADTSIASESVFRKRSERTILIRRLSSHHQSDLDNWSPNWNQANQPVQTTATHKWWRIGHAEFSDEKA